MVGRLDDRLARLENAVDGLRGQLRTLRREGEAMAQEIDNLITEVQRTTSVHESAIQVLHGIADRIQAGIDAALEGGATRAELAQLQGQADTLRVSADRLADAVVANTPAAPPTMRR
jgi:chromosome segregation ATPase